MANKKGLNMHGMSIREWIRNTVNSSNRNNIIHNRKLAKKAARDNLVQAVDILLEKMNELPIDNKQMRNIKNSFHKAVIALDSKDKKTKISINTIKALKGVITSALGKLSSEDKNVAEKAVSKVYKETVKEFKENNATYQAKAVEANNKYSKTELWLLVLFLIVDWYLVHEPKKKRPFAWRYSTIQKTLAHYGYYCTIDGIQEALRVLKDLDLIKVVYPRNNDGSIMTRAEWEANGHNPKKYVYRTIYIKWGKLYKYLSIYTPNDAVFKRLGIGAKSRLKKLIFKRPMSFINQAVFKRAKEEVMHESYKTSNEMFFGFISEYSTKYYNPTNKLKLNVPEHLIDLQKEQDSYAESLNKRPHEVNERPPVVNEHPSIAKEFFNTIK